MHIRYKIRTNRLVYSIVILVVTLLAGSSAPSFGAGIIFDSLNQAQGFNFQRDVQDPVGYLNSLKIGTQEIKADMKLRTPDTLDKGRSELGTFLGVLAKINWGGGISDPFELTCHISTYNKQKISTLLHRNLQNISVEFSFIVYDYDPIAKKYFPGFRNITVPLKGFLFKEGGKDLQIKIEGKGTEVSSPENWALSLKIVPQAIEQEVKYAVAAKDAAKGKETAIVKKWGQKSSR